MRGSATCACEQKRQETFDSPRAPQAAARSERGPSVGRESLGALGGWWAVGLRCLAARRAEHAELPCAGKVSGWAVDLLYHQTSSNWS